VRLNHAHTPAALRSAGVMQDGSTKLQTPFMLRVHSDARWDSNTQPSHNSAQRPCNDRATMQPCAMQHLHNLLHTTHQHAQPCQQLLPGVMAINRLACLQHRANVAAADDAVWPSKLLRRNLCIVVEGTQAKLTAVRRQRAPSQATHTAAVAFVTRCTCKQCAQHACIGCWMAMHCLEVVLKQAYASAWHKEAAARLGTAAAAAHGVQLPKILLTECIGGHSTHRFRA
jgi:hypothetical protein